MIKDTSAQREEGPRIYLSPKRFAFTGSLESAPLRRAAERSFHFQERNVKGETLRNAKQSKPMNAL
jgi:hypothetical protein